jgi:hypothetical protein
MASNKKWFKRAMRTLIYGERQLWGLIKERLTSEQVAYVEKEFSLVEATEKNLDTGEVSVPEAKTPTKEAKKKTSTASPTKTKRRTKPAKTRAPKKRANKET